MQMLKIDGRKLLLTVLFVLILITLALLIGRISYGYLAPNLGDDVVSSGDITANGDTLIFKKGGALSLKATTDNFYTSKGNLTDRTNPKAILIAKKGDNGEVVSATANYNVGVNISSNTFNYTTESNTAELILTVRDESGTIIDNVIDGLPFTEVNGISGYDITGKTGIFSIDNNHVITSNDSRVGNTQEWTFTLTLINLDTDQSLNENASLVMNIILQTDEITGSTPVAQG